MSGLIIRFFSGELMNGEEAFNVDPKSIKLLYGILHHLKFPSHLNSGIMKHVKILDSSMHTLLGKATIRLV